MPPLDEAESYDALRNYAWSLGFFTQKHRNFDPLRQAPGRENACWYLQRSNQHQPGMHQDSILRYSTYQEVRAWLDEFKRTMEKSHVA
jgi:hypothetical protein